ncbi:xanthine dehydrogenase accessory protein XdhC [Aestuariibacter sp. AA17]|uniref:Xanthine dehydrogenase accessory protein XdhC n=1 Tax=Fluctibacter corallii TaxID=2984329 RepID=A0ABT3A6C7_9ALTE|nr:xanthine dehydrogenase accessory protein XdhC [Aestuariibacter sp. AA17]MCV2884230.1 xanthine dehydrogenase accessory protein XdhC [Aestuariibacter sp. AA17]
MNRPNNWCDAVAHCKKTGQPFALLTVLPSSGSTPRDVGAKMVVTPEDTYDTIGGGHLEFDAIQKARDALLSEENRQLTERYPLSAKLGQCCGGEMHILIESFVTHQQTLYLFGAGHVASALVPILAQLPLTIYWIDEREALFGHTVSYSNVTTVVTDDPTEVIETTQSNHNWALIMTHNHQLDFDIARHALLANTFSYVGMIGSDTKAQRFTHRLKARDVSEQQMRSFVSPVGDLRIPGKKPIEVAVSIAAQLILMLNKGKSDAIDNSVVSHQVQTNKVEA